MKRLYMSLSILIAGIAAEAQVPQAFNYQAIARDNSGAVLNAWNSISDSTKNSHFLALDGEQLLDKIMRPVAIIWPL